MGRQKRNGAVDFQVVENAENVTEAKELFTEQKNGTFSINVTSDEIDPETKKKKVLYANEEEPFTYPQVIGKSIINVFRDAGMKFSEEQLTMLSDIFAPVFELDEKGEKTDKETEDSKATGKAVKDIVNLYDNKLKADAKASAYQGLTNKYKPLEGEKKESAQARMVANAIKLGGLSKEAAIEMLKMGKVLPEDYTVADFDSTPLRRTKSDDNDE